MFWARDLLVQKGDFLSFAAINETVYNTMLVSGDDLQLVATIRLSVGVWTPLFARKILALFFRVTARASRQDTRTR